MHTEEELRVAEHEVEVEEQHKQEEQHEVGNSSPDMIVDEAAADEQVLTSRRFSFSWPSRAQLLTWLPFFLVILLGAVLRFWGLGDKPLHHDESLHAYFSLLLMRFNMEQWSGCFNGTLSAYCYHYDPLTHGPFQFHAIAFVYKISQWLGASDNG